MLTPLDPEQQHVAALRDEIRRAGRHTLLVRVSSNCLGFALVLWLGHLFIISTHSPVPSWVAPITGGVAGLGLYGKVVGWWYRKRRQQDLRRRLGRLSSTERGEVLAPLHYAWGDAGELARRLDRELAADRELVPHDAPLARGDEPSPVECSG